jgi:cytochrome c oxidase subunit II
VNEPRHLRRIAIASLILAAIATPIVVAVIVPSFPPGNATDASSGQVYDNTVLFGVVTPIAAAIVVYFVYSLIFFRRQEAGPREGTAAVADSRVQIWWLVVTSIIVVFLAAFGTIELADAGSGGGQGPSPAYKPSGKSMPVQAIAQQWQFTYRYPTFGGIETAHLELPVDRQIELHVTSLDVIHSFWAPRLGVKVDANPGVDNIAYFTPEEERTFELKCSELCGLWHGYMFDTGEIVSRPRFLRWIHGQQRVFDTAAKALPPYATHYFPEPDRRGG